MRPFYQIIILHPSGQSDLCSQKTETGKGNQQRMKGTRGAAPKTMSGQHSCSKWPEVASLSGAVISCTAGLLSGAAEGTVATAAEQMEIGAPGIPYPYLFISFLDIFSLVQDVETLHMDQNYPPYIKWYHKIRLQRLQTSLTQGCS